MSRIIVPLHLANLANIPIGTDPGFKKLYLKANWIKLYDGVSETDLVLDRPLDNFTPILGTITPLDTVLTALEKLQYAITSIPPPNLTLQQVTDAGSNTTNDIILNSLSGEYGDYVAQNTIQDLGSYQSLISSTSENYTSYYAGYGFGLNASFNTLSTSIYGYESSFYVRSDDSGNIEQTGTIGFEGTDGYGSPYLSLTNKLGKEGKLKVTNILNDNVTLQFPNKPTGEYTIATIDDIAGAIPNIDAVLETGNTAVDKVLIFNSLSDELSSYFSRSGASYTDGIYILQNTIGGFLYYKSGSSLGHSTEVTFQDITGYSRWRFRNLPTLIGEYQDIAALSDIPSLTGYATESWVGSNYYPLLSNPAGYLTSASLTGYVPYIGATTDVDLGEKELTTSKLWLYDAAGGPTEKGSLHYADEALHFENSDGETLMYIEPGFMQLHKTGAIQSNFFFSNLTQNRDHYLPDASGTIALTSDIPSVIPHALTKTNDTNVTITLGGTPNSALLQDVSLTLGWTGTLADSRIASAITWNNKEPGITAGTTSQYWRGDKTWQTFPTIPTVGTWGALNYPTWSSGIPFVKMTAAGTFTLDTNTYLTSITSSNVTTALGFTPYNATNPAGYTSNLGTVTSVAAITLGTSGSDLSSSVATGTTTPVITLNVPTASAANRGVLSSTDWSAFNNKQSALGFTPVTNIRTLTINGTAYDLTADRSWTISASGKSINTISINTTAGATASTDYIYLCSGTINITLPTAISNQNLYTIKNVGTGIITINTTSSQTIDGSLNIPINLQYQSLTLVSDNANWNII